MPAPAMVSTTSTSAAVARTWMSGTMAVSSSSSSGALGGGSRNLIIERIKASHFCRSLNGITRSSSKLTPQPRRFTTYRSFGPARRPSLSAASSGVSTGAEGNVCLLHQGRCFGTTSSSSTLRSRQGSKANGKSAIAAGSTVALLLLVAAWHTSSSSSLHTEAAGPKSGPGAPGPKDVRPIAAGDPEGKLISMDEVEEHDSLEKGFWVVIQGEVYDLTEFVELHPGGQHIIKENAGKDVTDVYMPIHPADAISKSLSPSQHLGSVDPKTVKVVQREETEQERARRIALENLPPVGAMLNLDDFERVAKTILSDQAWAYYSSAGDDEVTCRENRQAFGRVFFKPRILRPVGQVDMTTSLVQGTVDAALPVYVSPAAMAKLGHADGELNLTRAAGLGGIVQGMSANASVSLDEMLDARKPAEQPLIYQLYVNRDRASSERILRKVEERGCKAVMLTVDAPVMGKRERDMKAKGEVVETGANHGQKDSSSSGGGVSQAISGYIDPNLSWEDVKWYRQHCKLPLIIKGVQTVEDVQLAVDHGVQGVILSNHGGRSLDFSRPALDVLIELRQRAPHLFDEVEIWMDGGVRRGTDVLKALALGAKAVGLGRPFLYAQSGFGQAGAERAIAILRDEIERGMRFLGVTRLDQLKPEMVEVLPRVFASTPRPSPSDMDGQER